MSGFWPGMVRFDDEYGRGLRLLADLHRDLSQIVVGKAAWVAGADRREAPGRWPAELGRRLRLRRQPPQFGQS